ncbi:MAG: hypothetical protein J6T91_05285 [Alphaproteobacteria bacterium]|nr:hypothetical protein [Alphaproteobacteria bacterium]
MTDETRKSVKKSNKIEKEEKHSILIRILTTFVTTLRFLNQKIKFSVYLFLNLKNFFSFRRFTSGYVLILTVVALPVLLYGAKYLLDHRTLLDRKVMDSSLEGKRLVKFCAKDAAQAVAAKWNPALTYKQQREAMLRIADEIYNASPTYEISLITQALHGIDIPKEVISKGGAYDPIKITRTLSDEGLSPSLKQIARTSQTTSMNRYYFYYFYSTYRAPMALYHFYIMYNSFKRENANLFPPDEDLYTDYTYYCSNTSDPFGKGWYHYVTWPEVVGMFDKDGSPSVGTKSYTTRTDLDDETVKIEIEDDKIKVTTDDDVAYAVPEECNVDIILTVPTNSAAMNPDNLDKNTVTSGTPYISTSKTPTDEAKSTPIYQITRAYQKFLKENFFYTRGVNVGVIPYSGKVSLRKDRSNWVKDPDTFVPDYFLDGSSPPMIMGSMMYGTYGTAGADLTSIGNYAGVNQSPTIYGYGLLCRGETQSYNGNTITLGDLLSTENPKNYKFRRMIYNPCYAGYANLLSMKCEKDCNKHWMNPYFILELNPDVKFIYNMLGAFYPYYDDRNVSNFIFIPVTWANNLLQSWSATGENSAVNTSDDSENLGRLSTPSKMTPGRRKALILIVNKPDWFEPGELTYLGFDNDFSEVPMYESDTISGEIDYSDTTQKFADGSSYDGTIQGAKKILKLEKVRGDDLVRNNGFYECGKGTYRLTFPKKQGTVRLTVAPPVGSISFYNDNEIADNVGTHAIDEEKTFTFTGGQEPSGKYIAVNSTRGPNFGHNLSLYKVRYSCRNCHILSATLTNQWIRDYSGQYSRGADTNYKPLILSDGTLAKQSGSEAANTYNPAYTYGLASGEYIKGSEMYNNLVDIYLPRFRDPCYSVWNIYGIYMDERFAEYRSNGGRGNNYECRALGTQGNCLFCVLGQNKRTYLYINPNESDTDYGNNKTAEHWSNYSLNLPLNAEVMFMRVGFVLQHYLRNGVNKILQSTSPYSSVPTGLSENEGIYLVNLDTNLSDKIVAGEYICFNGDGELSVTVTPVTAAESESKIAFTNIFNEETITEEKTYTFTPDQVSGGSDGEEYYIEFSMNNIKLISAEITNRPYVTVTPIVATYVNNVKYTSESDSITFSSGATAGSNGYLSYSTTSGTTTYDSSGRVCEGSATGRLSFPHKGQVTLTMALPTGKATFYSDNITDSISTNSSLRISGDSNLLPLGEARTVSGERTFVFNGGGMHGNTAASAQSCSMARNSSNGPNFGHNLCVKKVRYSLSNAEISDCVLKSQILRDYIGKYGYGFDPKVLILSDGSRAIKEGSKSYSVRADPFFMTSNKTVYVGDSNDLNISKFRETCIKPLSEYLYYGGDDDHSAYKVNITVPLYVEVSGVSAPVNVNFDAFKKAATCSYYYADEDRYGDSFQRDINKNVSNHGWSYVTYSNPSGLDDAIRLELSSPSGTMSPLYQYYIQNTQDKTLQKDENDKPIVITTNPIEYPDLISNKGVYLADYNDEKWICFQGDGQLSVTVKEQHETQLSQIKFNNVSDDNTAHSINGQTPFTISADKLTGGSNGNYYVEFDMDNITMVSASYTYSSTDADGTITESVYDVIDFANSFNGQNGVLSASNWTGAVSNGLYVVNSSSDARIASTKRGNIRLVVAPAIQSVDGSIQQKYGTNTTSQTISSKTTVTINASDMVDTGSNYYMDIGAERVVILYAKWEPISEKLQLPKRSRVIDFSQNPLDTNEISVNSEFYNHWEYNTNNGYWTNTDSTGDGLFGNYYPSGDYTVIGYGDKSYDALRYHANGTISDNNNTYWKYDMFKTAGLNRIFVDWEDKPTIADYTIRWPKYKNDNPGSLYWMMGTMTLPINASLWIPIGAFEREKLENSESAVYYDSHYQLDKEGNYNIVQSASGVAMSITSDACSKLKEDWGEDLRIYVIKYRKQTKYKIETGVELDYFYNNLRSCVSYPQQWKEPYVYDISTPDELNDALEKIAQDIKNPNYGMAPDYGGGSVPRPR